MAFNETVLFTYLRRAPFGGRLTQAQVEGVNRLIRICQAEGLADLRHVANVLAQVFHETGGRMQPVREAFQDSDQATIAALDRAWASGRLTWVKAPYWRSGFFGRGDIQITHRANYEKLGVAIGVNIAASPSKALDPEVSGLIAVVGMRDGLFTGRKLADYFSDTADDPKGARAIVNGKDKADLIAGYHRNFLGALTAAETSTPVPTDVSPRAAEPDDVKPVESKSLWAIIGSILSAGGLSSLSFLQNLNNVWSLLAFTMIFVAACVFGWLLLKGRITINRSPADTAIVTGALQQTGDGS
jgi:putative chitinase